MTVMHQPVRLAEARVPEAAAVLGRAFCDDPTYVFVMPDAAQRARVLPTFFAVGVVLGCRYGEVYGTAGGLDAVAVWLPPDAEALTQVQLDAAGDHARREAMGEAATDRFRQVLAVWEDLHRHDMPLPHWYLRILGVDPSRQGQGVGGQLLRPVPERADAAGLPCYLETASARNVPFYEKHGFEVLVEGELPGGGFRYWPMRRMPRTA